MSKKRKKVEPVRRRCMQCKRRRVIGHHKYCNKCWNVIHAFR